uniref:Uncharacterized protein n=1 Tax=Solanum lycopersicum TaxID=4081 RepID=K4CSL3_SOLLC
MKNKIGLVCPICNHVLLSSVKKKNDRGYYPITSFISLLCSCQDEMSSLDKW